MDALGLTATHGGLAPAEFVTSRLAKGDFAVAVGDLAIGLDPDLYPLLASSQTVTGGSNVVGLQDPRRSIRCSWRPAAPAPISARTAAYSALQQQLASGPVSASAGLRRRVVVVRDSVVGPAVGQVVGPG